MAGPVYDLSAPCYTPNRLLNEVSARMGAKSDRDLGRRIGIDNTLLSRVRLKQTQFSANLLLRIIIETAMSYPEICTLGGLVRLEDLHHGRNNASVDEEVLEVNG